MDYNVDMDIRRVKLGQTEKEIIKWVGMGLLVMITLGSPSSKMPKALLDLTKRRGIKYFKNILRNLEDKNIVNLGGDRVHLTRRGKDLFNIIKLQELKIPTSKKWDKNWHLVSYDIPIISSKKRDWFRTTLISLGFKKIQDSLWVFPFECKEEIAIIARNLGINEYVVVMTTNRIPNQKNFENFFFDASISKSQRNPRGI